MTVSTKGRGRGGQHGIYQGMIVLWTVLSVSIVLLHLYARHSIGTKPPVLAPEVTRRATEDEAAFAMPEHQIRMSVAGAFSSVYKNGMWTLDGGGSGKGSTIQATGNTRKVLHKIVRDYRVQAMADVPCGAMVWMPLLLQDIEKEQPGFRYLGGDIVPSVVRRNRERLQADHPHWQFSQFDITSMTVPMGYDMILCRDALQHLSFRMIVEALRKFAASNARILVTGSYATEDGAENVDKFDSDYFHINLREPPFSLNQTLAVYREDTARWDGDKEKYLLVYDVNYLRAQDFDAMAERARNFG